MPAQDPDTSPEPEPTTGRSFGDVPQDSPTATAAALPGLSRALWLRALGAALAAGLLGALVGEATYHYIQPHIVLPPDISQRSPYERIAIISNEESHKRPVSELYNTILAYGALAAALGGGLGLAAGLGRGDRRAGLSAALGGALGGVVAVAAASAIAVPLFFRLNQPDSGMLILFPVHAVILAAVGAGGGLGFGLGLGDRRRIASALLAGILGGLLGAFVFEAIYGIMYPLARTFEPIPDERIPRVAAHLCVAVCTGLVVVLFLARGRARAAAPGRLTPTRAPG